MQKRLQITIKGAVQGVGFRPFVYRLATELNLKGWVNNTANGVKIEVEGEDYVLNQFVKHLTTENPPSSHIQSLESQALDLFGYQSFEILKSVDGDKNVIVLPDLSTCTDCLKELFDSNNRRYHYPFINCTHCGPRYSIIEALPYDRPYTTMKGFKMCPNCENEYNNPLDRRFHAQPNACPVCGPYLQLWDEQGNCLATHEDALKSTVEAIKEGKILAIKGLGGFHLIVDSHNEEAVRNLRQRKHRPDKPFALMYPNLESVKRDCAVSTQEEVLLSSPQCPIVLLKRQNNKKLAPSIAPNNPYLGVMLPYTPLHHLLLHLLPIPLVATSGNLSDEPICIDENEALKRLNGVADLFLVHNRPIVRPIDDSIVRAIAGEARVIRRARGYAPFPITVTSEQLTVNSEQLTVNNEQLTVNSEQLTVNSKQLTVKNSEQLHSSILGVGGQLKNTVAILKENNIFISQHIGDLGTQKAEEAFFEVMNSLTSLYDFKPDLIVCDKHPNYYSTQYAYAQNKRVIPVQHHYAHILAGMADNEIHSPVLGVAWDGTGYGDDGTIWGGEFIQVTDNGYERVAYFEPFPLVGGDKAIKEPRRVALGLMYGIDGHLENVPDRVLAAFTSQELNVFKTLLNRSFNTPLTSSVGRLFDGVASLLGCYHKVSFEGQAAMALEFACLDTKITEFYHYSVSEQGVIHWKTMIREILEDIENNLSLAIISAKFHNTLIEVIITIAKKMKQEKILLTGGCFQNGYLTEKAILRLQQEGFKPYTHLRLPPNDGSIAVGQIMAALRGGFRLI